ncbi:MAG: ABC transporter permease [Rhodospirillaceae bacterium]|nr:ABC transporter permease [Rhodospirillaceae bacterium]MDE0619476.1 ABC transporter permease [Rhodospirillaceae bacterium]
MRRLTEFWRRYRRNVLAVLAFGVLLVVAAMAVFADLLYPQGPWEMVTRPFLWPGDRSQHLLGSDMLGRDVMAGIVHGSRVSLLIGVVATAVAFIIGTLVGATAGYFRGWVDDVLMRFTEIFQTIPPFMFLIVLVAIFKPSVTTITLAIGIVSWPTLARLVRSEFLTLRERDFVQAGFVIGMSNTRIILTQILPNALPPVIVTSSVIVATAIINESALSFLGLGDPNLMSWGTMIGAGRQVLRNAWYLTALPGIAILLTVLALNIAGDGLNDALNPRLKSG